MVILQLSSLNTHWCCCSRPPLRGFLMDGDFYVAASLATTLTKVALRYVAIVQDKKKQNVSCPLFSSLHWHLFKKTTTVPLTPAASLSLSVLRCRGHADHGHCAAPGQVLSAQEANYRRWCGPHLTMPEGPVRVLATYEWHFQQGVPQIPVTYADCQTGGREAVTEGNDGRLRGLKSIFNLLTAEGSPQVQEGDTFLHIFGPNFHLVLLHMYIYFCRRCDDFSQVK